MNEKEVIQKFIDWHIDETVKTSIERGEGSEDFTKLITKMWNERADEYLKHLKKTTETIKKTGDPLEDAVWKMKGGNEVPMAMMDDEHLMNCVWLIQRDLAKKKLLQGSKMDTRKYLSLRQYDALCYHAIKRKLAKKGTIEYDK